MHDFTNYPDASTPVLLNLLANVVSQLSNLHEEIAMIQGDEARQKARALQAAQETTSTGREQHVRMTVVEPVATRHELEGKRDSLLEQRDFIRTLISYRARREHE